MTVIPTLFPQALLASCSSVRQVQLPARTFHLLARTSSQHRRLPLQQTQVSWFHVHQSQRQQELERQEQSKQQSQQQPWQPFGEGTKIPDSSQQSINEQDPTVKSRRNNYTSDRTTSTERSKARDKEHSPGIDPDVSIQQSEVDPTDAFRGYMRTVPYPVAIVTSSDPEIDTYGDPIAWRGATVSSFNSVAISPDPYVSFNIKKVSSTLDAIQHSGLFTVHVMGKTPEAAEIATLFSRGNDAAPFFDSSPRPSKKRSKATTRATNTAIASAFNADTPARLDSGRPSPQADAATSTRDSDNSKDSNFDDQTLTNPNSKPRTLQPFVRRNAYAARLLSDILSPVQLLHMPPSIAWSRPWTIGPILFTVLCELQPSKQVEVGDHVIVVGKVLQIRGMRDKYSATELAAQPEDEREMEIFRGLAPTCLTYVHGDYRNVSKMKMKKSSLRLFDHEDKLEKETGGGGGDGVIDENEEYDETEKFRKRRRREERREQQQQDSSSPTWRIRMIPFDQ